MEIHLGAVEYNVEKVRNHDDLVDLWRIRNDPDLSRDGRTRLEAEILPKLTDRFYEIRQANETLVEGARKEFRGFLPDQVQRRASLRNPKRAIEVRDLASGMGAEGIEAMIEDVKAEKDLAAAFGLRMAALEVEDEEVRSNLIEKLNGIGSEGHEKRLGILLAIQQAAAEFEARGPDQDPDAVLKNPAKVMALSRGARTVPVGPGGEEREIDEKEAQCYMALVNDS